MGELGIVTGRQNGKNIDGDATRRLLQVNMLDLSDTIKDVRTVELVSLSGDDTNPANDCRAFIIDAAGSYSICIAITDDLTPEVDPGERELYSTDNPVTQKLAKIRLNSSSEVVMNDGTDYAVKYNELKTAFDQLKADFDALVAVFNAHLHSGVTAGGSNTGAVSATGTPSTADMSGSKVDTVRMP